MSARSTDPRTVRVGMVAPAAMNAPLYLAEDDGELDRRGLAVQSRVIGSTDGTTDALLDGEIDVAFGSPDVALTSPDRLRILAGIIDRPPLSLVCRRGLTSFEALRGRTLGVTSLREGTVQLIQAMLAEHDLQYPDDYGLALAGTHPQRWRAMQRDELDAAMQLMPFDAIAEDAGYPVLGRAEDVVPYFAFASVCVRADWPTDLAEAVHGALLVGERIMRDDRARAVRVIADRVGIPATYAERCVARLVDEGAMPVGLVHSEEAVRRTRQAIEDNATIAGQSGARVGTPD